MMPDFAFGDWSYVPTSNVRRLRAYLGSGSDRRLHGMVDVSVSDQTATLPDGSIVPTRHLVVLAWRLCDVSAPSSATTAARCP